MINTLLETPEKLNAEDIRELDELIKKYPYCATYRLLRSVALANVHSTSLSESVKRTAAFLPDRTSLFLHINNGEFEWASLFEQLREKRKNRSESADDFLLIDQYLDHLHLPESIGTTYTYDLSKIDSGLDQESDEYAFDSDTTSQGLQEEDDTLSLIDSFLSAEAEGQLFTPTAPVTNATEEDSEGLEKIRDRAILSESLAKVYVKQHKYEQALAIFSSLNLQYSKKSSYFADQIRFLEKVIAYQKDSNEGDA